MSVACKKNTADPLPPETHTGAFTFGCIVDGKVYTASGQDGFFDHVSYNLNAGFDSAIYISAVSRGNPSFNFDLFIHYTGGGPGIYQMKDYPYQGTFTDDSNGTIPGLDNTYTTTNTITGSITITYFNGSLNPFIEGTILSGTFQMDAVNGEGKVIHITEGRFDIGH